MSNEELVKRAGELTLATIRGELGPVRIHGIQITDIDRDIYRGVTLFAFENGWLIPIKVDYCIEQSELIRMLTIQVEEWIRSPDRTQLEAFNAPETLIDEDPDELDPYPVFFCQCCRDDCKPW